MWYAILLLGAPEFFTRGGLVAVKLNCESDFCQLVIAHERSAKVGICKTAPAKSGSIFL